MKLLFVPLAEIKRVRASAIDNFTKLQILADIFRLNTLSMIMEAGSGHIGTSFSCLDIITWLWAQEMNLPNENLPGSDTYFSSKGHDAPALYSLLIGLEKLDYSLIHKLRRLNGLPGHPDVRTPFIVTNTGSLGMGISKARGMAEVNRRLGRNGHFYILTGDGELQEGQIWESLQPTANKQFAEITVIVDHNKIQSDTLVSKTSNLGNLEEKFRSFGWETARCDGHNFFALQRALAHCRTIKNRPQILIADTVKGKGVSFMEKLSADGLYKFHSGAPKPEDYLMASAELADRINSHLKQVNLTGLALEQTEVFSKSCPSKPQKLISAHADELAKIAAERKDIIALDADLMVDAGAYDFQQKFPARHIECGIAEQDMVSLAGGLALRGMLAVAHSFACFLSTRANEQIYNNLTEHTKIIYVGALAGLLPATPGHSHQSVRDISIIGSMPGIVMIQPGTENETRQALRWAVERNPHSTYIRLVNLPVEVPFSLNNYPLVCGQGRELIAGKSAILFAYGPVMLKEAYLAAQILKQFDINLAVYDLPWLNRLDLNWLRPVIDKYRHIFTLDDHYTLFGQGSVIASALGKYASGKKIINLGVNEIPECGQPDEVLNYHQLDCESLAKKIRQILS